MSNTFSFTFLSDADHFEVICYMDDHMFYQGRPGRETRRVVAEFDDDDFDSPHTVSIELRGKTHSDTTVLNGEIVADALLHVQTVEVDDFDLTEVFFKQSVYHHDFNGTREAIDDIFNGRMGCNGRVTFEFKSPVYVWLLDNI